MFLDSVFYVGKGKGTRPYHHLQDAAQLLRRRHEAKGGDERASRKCLYILDLWAKAYGVLSVHCFQNIIPAEAYTREAAVIDAIGHLPASSRPACNSPHSDGGGGGGRD